MRQLRFLNGLVLCTFVFAASLHADDDPIPDTDPVDVSDIGGVGGNAKPANPNSPQALIVNPGYDSIMLKAKLNTQWMKLKSGGQTHLFWGARIVEMDPTSPLATLGLKTNDVITRLDSVKVSNRMTALNTNFGPTWKLPESESHYGLTAVRYILHKTRSVQEQTVDLGSLRTHANPPGPAPLDP
jgi:hypothetical protein